MAYTQRFYQGDLPDAIDAKAAAELLLESGQIGAILPDYMRPPAQLLPGEGFYSLIYDDNFDLPEQENMTEIDGFPPLPPPPPPPPEEEYV